MPAIAQKAKALSVKGVVLSYVDKPENFYWREQVPSTKRYLHRLLPNSSTLEEALEECIEAYTALRKDQAITHGTDGRTPLRALESQGRATRNSNNYQKYWMGIWNTDKVCKPPFETPWKNIWR